MLDSLERWEFYFNKSLEKDKLDYQSIKKMLVDSSFTRQSLEELKRVDKEFNEQLKILSEHSISAFELLSVIVGDSEFIKDYNNIYFHGFDLKTFDSKYIFDDVSE